MKKRISAIAVVVICLAILATGTLAYFTDTEQAHNIITSGNIEIALEEFFPGSKEDPEQEDTYILENVMPGQTAEKQIWVENTGVGDAWIRAKLHYEFTPAELSVDVISIELLPGWIDGGDGWYYYENVVSAKQNTSDIIDCVAFAPEMGNEYQNSTLIVKVEAQAVQAKNNMPESGSVLDVAGWPAP